MRKIILKNEKIIFKKQMYMKNDIKTIHTNVNEKEEEKETFRCNLV